MIELPKGSRTLEDIIMIDHLLKDEIFIKSVEEDFGKVVHIYADWPRDKLVYKFLSGETKISNLSIIVQRLKAINYMKNFEN